MEWVLLLLVGYAASSLGSLLGLGGGIIIVPLLLYLGSLSLFPDISPQAAVGTSLFTMIFTGLSSTLAYIKHKTIDYKSGLLFLAGSAPGGILGAWLNKFFDLRTFSIYFGMFILCVSIIMMVKNKLKPLPFNRDKGIIRMYTEASGVTHEYGFNPAAGFLIAFLVGVLSGMFGVGGGSLMVPAMMLLFFFPPHVAVATSMFMIFPTSIISSATHLSMGNVDWHYALVLIPGAWAGAKAGVFLNRRLQSQTIVTILKIILILIGIRLIYQGMTV